MYFFLRVFLVANLFRGRSRRMTDKQHLRTWEIHQLQPLDMPWWRNNYRRKLELHTLEVLQTPSVGEVCEYPEVSSFSIHILSSNWCYFLHLALYKKKKKMNERSCHGDNIESSSTKWCGKYSQCPAFDIKQNPARRSPEDHQVRTHAYLSLNKAQSCFLAPFICSRIL